MTPFYLCKTNLVYTPSFGVYSSLKIFQCTGWLANLLFCFPLGAEISSFFFSLNAFINFLVFLFLLTEYGNIISF